MEPSEMKTLACFGMALVGVRGVDGSSQLVGDSIGE
jgi:hypothetical protein